LGPETIGLPLDSVHPNANISDVYVTVYNSFMQQFLLA